MIQRLLLYIAGTVVTVWLARQVQQQSARPPRGASETRPD